MTEPYTLVKVCCKTMICETGEQYCQWPSNLVLPDLLQEQCHSSWFVILTVTGIQETVKSETGEWYSQCKCSQCLICCKSIAIPADLCFWQLLYLYYTVSNLRPTGYWTHPASDQVNNDDIGEGLEDIFWGIRRNILKYIQRNILSY